MAESLSSTVRRARIREFKDAFPPMGVYAVRNSATGRAWVGASRNVDGALNRIRFELQMHGHRDRSLADEWARHGAQSFRFEVLERVRKRDDPAFDYEAELQALLALWTEELGASGEGGQA
ncbi:hypothetical protein GCM10027034_09890 [Ramlibacter solisilvae]|uniref:GIY-YIG domain-containing protein n=1 Tax=Ramlibacter tataouinensis TaxID=94132 RepID=A0A127JXP7_9BURK|nr:GIY-YIG nuclease family protein [Ramlibacter tataouinensis]AMO24679.1 hypothetical protein UC35_19875 [Ramlibacter tataouinensis]